MKKPMTRLGLLCIVTAGLACTDAGLQPYIPAAANILDNKLQVQATVCTDPPDNSKFPVKILFVIDNSDSMNVTDPGRQRAQAVLDVINRFSGDTSVFFDIITFGTSVNAMPGPGNTTSVFTNTPDIGWYTQQLSVSDGTTDYQGALGLGFDILSQDMLANGPALNPRTKYVLVWFSDGFPDPQCVPGQPSIYLVCNQPRNQWPAAIQADFPAILSAGQAYNTPSQINQAVASIIGLQTAFKVGDMQFNSMLLTDPANYSAPIAQAFGINAQTTALARQLMQDMSINPGYGTYTEFSSASQISFLNFDYTAIPEPDAMAMFMANNVNSTLTGTDQVGDTDNDGVSDNDENTMKTCVGLSNAGSCAVPQDSDGDGYSDWFETFERQAGFDPKDPKKPVQPCTDRGDDDGDGLLNCEEAFVGTDPKVFDTDEDHIPDLVELRNGLDPLDPTDAQASAANDGIRNIDAIREHKNPLVPDPENSSANIHYLYEVSAAPSTADGATCYNVSASNIELFSNGQGTSSPRGINHIILTFIETPVDLTTSFGELKLACVTTRYIDGSLKEPASGIVALKPSDFHLADATHNLTAFKEADCVNVTTLKGQ